MEMCARHVGLSGMPYHVPAHSTEVHDGDYCISFPFLSLLRLPPGYALHYVGGVLANLPWVARILFRPLESPNSRQLNRLTPV